MPAHNTIEFRFLRKHKNAQGADTTMSSAHDDLLSITRVHEDMNRVVYTERSNSVPLVDVMRYTNHQLLSYLYRVFWLTSLDEDPFQSVQLFIPGMPSCLLSVPVVKQNVAQILDLVVTTYLNWPLRGVDRGESARQSSHLLPTVGSPEQAADDRNNEQPA